MYNNNLNEVKMKIKIGDIFMTDLQTMIVVDVLGEKVLVSWGMSAYPLGKTIIERYWTKVAEL